MKLNDLLAEFEGTDPEEALETLIDFSETLPPLSQARAAVALPSDCRIQECQTPVYLWVDVIADRVHLEASVPEKSPTVRGFVAMLVEGLNGASTAQVAEVSDDLLPRLGLSETLGMTRRQGFRGILQRIKRETAAKQREAAASGGI